MFPVFDPISFSSALTYLVLFSLLAASSYTDLKYRLIYNKVTLPCILIGWSLAGMSSTPQYVLNVVFASIFAFILFFVLFALRMMGGGDVKLVAAIGSLIGYPLIIDAMFWGILAGGIYAVAVLLWQGRLWNFMKRVFYMIGNLILWRRFGTIDSAGSTRMPYGVCISIGTVVAIIVRHQAGGSVLTYLMGP